MEKVLKTKYEEPRLDVAMFLNSDIITTSVTEDGVENVGSGNDIDDKGWTGNTGW